MGVEWAWNGRGMGVEWAGLPPLSAERSVLGRIWGFALLDGGFRWLGGGLFAPDSL